MFCPKCGKEIGNDAKFCGFCGNELGNENDKFHKIEQKGKFEIDSEGFVRKSRDNSGILFWIVGGAIYLINNKLPDEFIAIGMFLWPVGAYLLYLAIKKYSSHDIETWKYSSHTKLWIYVGSLLAGLVGIIVYYYLKGKEREYIANTRVQYIN